MLKNGENMKVRTKSGTIYWLHNINGKLRCFTLSGAERKVTKEMKELAGMGRQEGSKMTNIAEMLIQKAKYKKEVLDFLVSQNPDDLSLFHDYATQLLLIDEIYCEYKGIEEGTLFNLLFTGELK